MTRYVASEENTIFKTHFLLIKTVAFYKSTNWHSCAAEMAYMKIHNIPSPTNLGVAYTFREKPYASYFSGTAELVNRAVQIS